MTKKSKLIWFGNDADGLSMVDVLALGTFIIWIISKTLHLVLSLMNRYEPDTIIQLNYIMDTVDSFMGNVIVFYFGKKAIDTTVTKIGLFASKQYKEVVNASQEEISEEFTDDTTSR